MNPENRLTRQTENPDPETSSIIEKLDDLYRKGACTKNKAVSINRSFPPNWLDHAPVMVLICNLLNEIVASRTPLSADDAFDNNGEFWKSLCATNLEACGSEVQFYLTDGSPAILLLTELSAICADELGLLKEVDGRLMLTDSGIGFLRGTYRKRRYLQIAKFLEQGFSWFYFRLEEEGWQELWEWCTAVLPLALLILTRLGEDNEPVDAAILMDRTADLVPLPPDADASDAKDMFSDLFLAGYCTFLGFAEPVFDDFEAGIEELNFQVASGNEPDLEAFTRMMTPHAWSSNDLLYDIFIWEV